MRNLNYKDKNEETSANSYVSCSLSLLFFFIILIVCVCISILAHLHTIIHSHIFPWALLFTSSFPLLFLLLLLFLTSLPLSLSLPGSLCNHCRLLLKHCVGPHCKVTLGSIQMTRYNNIVVSKNGIDNNKKVGFFVALALRDGTSETTTQRIGQERKAEHCWEEKNQADFVRRKQSNKCDIIGIVCMCVWQKENDSYK